MFIPVKLRKSLILSMASSTIVIVSWSAWILVPMLRDQLQIQRLIQRLQDPDETVRAAAAEELGEFGSRARVALPALIAAMETDSSASAAFAICDIDPELDIAAPYLLEFLACYRPYEGIAPCRGPSCTELAQRSLRAMKSKVVPHLIVALTDPRPNLRAWSAQCLGSMRTDAAEAEDALRSALVDEDNLVRVCAARALWSIRGDSELSASVLPEVLADTDVRVAKAVQGLIAYELEADAIPKLLETIEQAQPIARMNALIAIINLCQMGNGSASRMVDARVITAALQDNDSGVREYAVLALSFARSNSPVVISSLLDALHDEVDAVRESAAYALGALETADELVLDGLNGLSLDRAHRVREAAANALVRIRSRQSSSITHSSMNDPVTAMHGNAVSL